MLFSFPSSMDATHKKSRGRFHGFTHEEAASFPFCGLPAALPTLDPTKGQTACDSRNGNIHDEFVAPPES